MPTDAVSKRTIDVDGDGRADTEWIAMDDGVEFGVTTASGATQTYEIEGGGGAPREGFIARFDTNRIVSMADDNRSVDVYFFMNCKWVELKNAAGDQYPLDFNGFRGIATGAGCSAGTLVSYDTSYVGDSVTITQTPITVSNGGVGTAGATVTVDTSIPRTDPRVYRAEELSCGTVTVKNGGVVFD
jgi:hypothetical protein